MALSESGGQSTILQKLRGLKDITKLTGTLDELQVRNLEMWGRVAFHPVKFGLNWNGIARTVEYDLQMKGGKPPPARTAQQQEAYLTAIDTSVKEMLGEEWLLTIKEDGRTVFTGPRKVAFTPPKSLEQIPTRGDMEFDARRK